MKTTFLLLFSAFWAVSAAAAGPVDGVQFIRSCDTLADGKPCVWFAVVADMKTNPDLRFDAVLVDGGSTPSKVFAEYEASGKGRPVAVANAGFFNMRTFESVSLLVSDSKTEAPDNNSASRRISSDSVVSARPIHAAFGQMPDGSFEAQWIYCHEADNREPYVYPFAVGNDDSLKCYSPTGPALGAYGAYRWDAVEAVGAGPMLVKDGRDVSLASSCGEMYYRTIGGAARHPRTAVGVTGDGKVILLVADGRGMNGSVGCTLSELADIMIGLGAVEAINLDGGGSSAMVDSDGKLMNRPSDTGKRAEPVERRVPTFVVIAEAE